MSHAAVISINDRDHVRYRTAWVSHVPIEWDTYMAAQRTHRYAWKQTRIIAVVCSFTGVTWIFGN